jgi:hypothetical protein
MELRCREKLEKQATAERNAEGAKGSAKDAEECCYSAPQRLKTSEPLVPPKPKLFDRA